MSSSVTNYKLNLWWLTAEGALTEDITTDTVMTREDLPASRVV